MGPVKFDYGLILLFFISNCVCIKTENTESEHVTSESWFGTLTSGIVNVIPWNWYDDPVSNLNFEFIKSDNEINRSEDDSLENNQENVTTISFSKLIKRINEEIASKGSAVSEQMSEIYEIVRKAISDNKLSTYVTLGGKKLLVNLGMLGSDERTKNFEEFKNSILDFLHRLINWLTSWIPGTNTAVNATTKNLIMNTLDQVNGLINVYEQYQKTNKLDLPEAIENAEKRKELMKEADKLSANFDKEFLDTVLKPVKERMAVYIITHMLEPVKKNENKIDFNIDTINADDWINKFKIILNRLQDLNSAYTALGLANKLDTSAANNINSERLKVQLMLEELAKRIGSPETNKIASTMKREIFNINDVFNSGKNNEIEVTIPKIEEKIVSLQDVLYGNDGLKLVLGSILQDIKNGAQGNIFGQTNGPLLKTMMGTPLSRSYFPKSCVLGSSCF